jgi:hypothetical protein
MFTLNHHQYIGGEVITGIRSKNATVRTGSSTLPDERALTIYLTRITEIGTINAKICSKI